MYFQPWPTESLLDRNVPDIGSRFSLYVCFTPSGFLAASTDLRALYEWRNAFINKGNNQAPIEISPMGEFMAHIISKGFSRGYIAGLAATMEDTIEVSDE